MIALVAAMAKNRVIGHRQQLPWHLPADLKHFRHLTWGKPVIMGRTTWQSLGKALPGRRNIVLSRDPLFRAGGAEVLSDISAVLGLQKEYPEIMIIGGSQIYEQFLEYAGCCYLTIVHQAFQGDAFFPLLDKALWRETARQDRPADDKNPHACSFTEWRRVSG